MVMHAYWCHTDSPEETAAAAEGADGANAGAGGASGAGSGPRVEEVSAATDKLVNFVITHYNQNTLFTYEQVAPLLTDDTDINAQTPVQPVKVGECICAMSARCVFLWWFSTRA